MAAKNSHWTAFPVGAWIISSLSPRLVRYALSNKRAYIATSWWHYKMETYPINHDNDTALERGKPIPSISATKAQLQPASGLKISRMGRRFMRSCGICNKRPRHD